MSTREYDDTTRRDSIAVVRDALTKATQQELKKPLSNQELTTATGAPIRKLQTETPVVKPE